MKVILEVIEVQATPGGRPRAFTWRGRRYPVLDLLGGWSDGGRWWRGEPPRDYFRVLSGRVQADLYREDRPGGRWWLSGIAD